MRLYSLARKRSRGRCGGETDYERKETGQRERRGLRGRFVKNSGRCCQRERSGSGGLIWRGVAGSHRAIRRTGLAVRTAIVLVFLHVAALTMVHGTVGGVAAGGRNGGGKRLGERQRTRRQQREERRHSQKLSRNFP